MRVISGSARHRQLISTAMPEMQPTVERVKEALFSKLQFELEGRKVLDLFSGSGQLGIEALSRGASFCDFVDNSRESFECISKNIKTCGFSDRAGLHFEDSFGFVKACGGGYDVVFLDPPFKKEILPRILPHVVKKTLPSGVIYCETHISEKLPDSVGDFKIVSTVCYGTIKTTYYRSTEGNE